MRSRGIYWPLNSRRKLFESIKNNWSIDQIHGAFRPFRCRYIYPLLLLRRAFGYNLFLNGIKLKNRECYINLRTGRYLELSLLHCSSLNFIYSEVQYFTAMFAMGHRKAVDSTSTSIKSRYPFLQKAKQRSFVRPR